MRRSKVVQYKNRPRCMTSNNKNKIIMSMERLVLKHLNERKYQKTLRRVPTLEHLVK